MRIKFWGAARTVTGSAHLLTVGGKNVLLDCGLFQGSRALGRKLNREFPLPPQQIDALVLSHTHIDHCGNIPNLVRTGYKRRIHCTSATADMARLLMLDSAHIQESDAEYLNRKAARNGGERIEPLYTMDDAARAGEMLEQEQYGKGFDVIKGEVTARFRDAGHVLGSAFVELELREDNRNVRFTFSGDVGRRNMPILRDPEAPEPADYLILESTYGDRLHKEYAMAEAELADAVNRVIRRRGKIVLPAFSVGRTQEIVYALNRLFNQGRLPRIPIYVDSPLSVNATEIFRSHPECYDDEIRMEMRTDPDPFGFDGLIYTRNVADSKRINLLDSPCIVISASGMAESGRILHHLKNTVDDPKNAVFIVGFQAENTLGRRIVERSPEVKILGEVRKLAAEVVTFNAFSAHADRDELREFARHAARSGTLKRIFLVHGEETPMTSLSEALREDLPGVDVTMPARGETFDL